MNISVTAVKGEVLVRYDNICGIAFNYAASWVESALLPVICDDFELSRDNCAHFSRIERLLPQSCPA